MHTDHPARILLVDDQINVLTVMQRMLAKVGHQVTATTSALEALELLRDPTRPIDLLITDILMPELDGLQLARTARKLRPELPLLFVSAYDDYDDELPFGERLLRKPFFMSDLVSTVEARLAEARSSATPT